LDDIKNKNLMGDPIGRTQDCYIEARKEFSEGGGNVIRQAEMLEQLGVKPSKAIPLQWVESAMEESIPMVTNDLDQ